MHHRARGILLSTALATSLLFGTHHLTAIPAVAQDHEVIRPSDVRPEQRIDLNGTLVTITHVENADQAKAVFFQGERDRYQRAGTDPMGRPYGLLLTSDMTGQPAFVVLDLSWLAEEDDAGFVNLETFEPLVGRPVGEVGTHETIQVQLHPLQDGTYLARAYWELAKGSKVNNTDWGVQERYTTYDDSINARTDNGPDDDEARAQGPTARTGSDNSQSRRTGDDDD